MIRNYGISVLCYRIHFDSLSCFDGCDSRSVPRSSRYISRAAIRMRTRITTAVAFVGLLSAVCTCERAPKNTWVRDSAGVYLVESDIHMLDLLPLWSISSTKVVVGGADAPDSLQILRGRTPTRLSDGAVLVSTDRSRLLVVDTSGELRVAMGHRGRGPGEFESLWSYAALNGDTIVAHDMRARRITIFSSQGKLLRTSPQTLFAGIGPLYSPDGSIAVVDDSIASRTFFQGHSYSGLHQDTASVLYYPRLDVGGVFVVTRVPSRWIWVDDKVWESIVYAGYPLLARDQERLIIAHGDHFAIDVWTVHGQKVATVRVASDRVRMDAKTRQFALDSAHALRPTAPAEFFSRIRIAEFVPAIEQLKVDADGCIWVRMWGDPAIDKNRWIILDARRGPLAQIWIPKSIRVSEIGTDELLSIAIDDDDVQSVVLSRFDRTVQCER